MSIWPLWSGEKYLVLAGNQTPEVQYVARHYSDYAIPVPDTRFILYINILLSFKQASSKRSTSFIFVLKKVSIKYLIS
jgi:hypothetical protein